MGNGPNAPIPAVRGAAVEPPSSTSYEPLPEPNASCSRCDGGRESRHEVVRQMKEAIASLDAAGDTLANDGAGAAEGGDGGLAPRRVVRVDESRRGAGLDGVAQFDERLEKPGSAGKGG